MTKTITHSQALRKRCKLQLLAMTCIIDGTPNRSLHQFCVLNKNSDCRLTGIVSRRQNPCRVLVFFFWNLYYKFIEQANH